MSKDPGHEFDPNTPVTEQASHWWVLLNAGAATAADHQAFGEWVARSPERVEAFLQTAWLTKALKSKQLRWPDTPIEVLVREAKTERNVVATHPAARFDAVHLAAPHAEPDEKSYVAKSFPSDEKFLPRGRIRSSPKGRFRRSALSLAAAAGFLGLMVASWILLDHSRFYNTAIGEQRSVVLRDGSIVTLNTASRIEVEFHKDRRLIHLRAGEALFQVARDSARPFDVIADDTTVRAVGTQFNVDKRNGSTTVTVVEGKVAVVANSSRKVESRDDLSLSSSPPSPAEEPTLNVEAHGTTYLTAGEQLTVAGVKAARSIPKAADLAAVTAWTQRRLVFEHRTLGDVADEFNRYNRRQIRIHGAELRAQEVTGVFQANDPESFLEFVSKIPGIKMERDADGSQVSASL